MPRALASLRALTTTLKFRLALASVLIISASVAVATQLVLGRVQRGVERAVRDLESGNAERLAMLLSARVVALQSALHATAGDNALEAALARPQSLPAYLGQCRVLLSMFSRLTLALPDGRVVALADGTSAYDPRFSIADRPYFQQTLAQRRPVVSEPIVSRVSKVPVLQFTMPVQQGTRVVAVLTGSVPLQAHNLLDDLTQGGQAADDPVTTIVIDASGRVLAHPQAGQVLSRAETDPRLAAAMARWAQQGRPVEPVGDVTNRNGEIVAMAGVPGPDWVVLRVSSEDALLGGVARARTESLRLAAAVALAGGLLVLALMAWLLRPLGHLQRRALALRDTADAIDQGWPQAHGEIGELAALLRAAMQGRRASEEQAAQLLRKMHSVMAAAPIGIAFSRQQRLELVSAEFAVLLGWDEAELVGREAREIYAAESDYAELGARVAAAFHAGRPFVDEMLFRRRDGSMLWARLQGRPVDAADAAAGTIWLLEDVTARRAERERLSWAAHHDALTRLPNRAAFEARLASLLQQTSRALPAALLYVDLDHFKQVNDRAGHAAGDRVLQDVAALLVLHVRGTDVVARLGGDEFVVLLQHCEHDAASRIAAAICEGAAQLGVTHGGQRLSIGASIGIVVIDGHDASHEALLARADAACYDAKRGGRNRVRVATRSADCVLQPIA